jgi:hypothetical protein
VNIPIDSGRGPDRRNFDTALLSFVAALQPRAAPDFGESENPLVEPPSRAGFRVYPRRDYSDARAAPSAGDCPSIGLPNTSLGIVRLFLFDVPSF